MPRYDPTPGGYSLTYEGDTTYMTVYLENDIYFSQATVAVCDTALYTYQNDVQIPSPVGLVGLGGESLDTITGFCPI